MDDPFSLLGLPRRFDVEPTAVQRAFVARSASVHGADMDDDEREFALAALGRAKATLERSESRAEALLGLLGGPGKERDRSLPDGFLMEMMEVRQAMEDELSGAGSARAASAAKWEAWAEERRRGHESAVAAMFARIAERSSDGGAVGEGAGATLDRVRRELNAWRYIERMIEQIDPAGGGLGDRIGGGGRAGGAV